MKVLQDVALSDLVERAETEVINEQCERAVRFLKEQIGRRDHLQKQLAEAEELIEAIRNGDWGRLPDNTTTDGWVSGRISWSPSSFGSVASW